MARFTVDTQLFRELGELLVGRDSTALIELVKNAYDADAEIISVYGEAIADTARGFIRLTDDGVGMTDGDFLKGFLRIASRSRTTKTRKSKLYGRRYTGEKGVGRLAAHKLASVVDVESIPQRNGKSRREALRATIDWDLVEQAETLDEIPAAAILLETETVPASARSGTTITLRGLRKRWTRGELANFLLEVQDFEVPRTLAQSFPKALFQGRRLFAEPKLRDSSSRDPGFDVKLEGDFEAGDEYWVALAESASWLIEIDARAAGVRYRVSPSVQRNLDSPTAVTRDAQIDHPAPETGPFFQSRILVQEGVHRRPVQQTSWARRNAGVRVFLEGFRILPYGDRNNDWLSLDYDYAARQRRLPGLKSLHLPDLEIDKDAALLSLPNRSYFGAVFMTQTDSRPLRTLVNREGFVPEQALYNLIEMVRGGIDLSVRVRAAADYERRGERRAARSERAPKTSAPTQPIARQLGQSIDQALAYLAEAQAKSKEGDASGSRRQLSAARSEIKSVADRLDDLASEEAMIRVLASVGTQMAAFVHEINALLASTESLESQAIELLDQVGRSASLRKELAEFQASLGDLRRGLERQAAYLIDVVTPDARRRRRRLGLAERFDAALGIVETTIEVQEIRVRNNIPRDLRTPPMFPAELTAVLTNLLTNAVKAVERGGKIRASGARRKGAVRFALENSGTRVNLREASRWFEPFESTTTDIDPVLGQGMGLGLPITRRVLDEYGASIEFIRPPKGYSTAIEIVFPEE